LLDPPALLDALREAFAAYSTDRSVDAMRVPVPLPAGQVPPGASGMLLAPGVVHGIPAYSVKVHAKFPGSDPAIRGLLVLHDLATGVPLAVMESSYLTALRTGLVGALGADVLARPTASTVAIIGAGTQGQAQLAAFTTTYSYDRAGLGWSAANGQPCLPQAIAADLHAILKRLKVQEPYILVAHSFGAYVLLAYAQHFGHEGDRIAGLVLVDPLTPEEWIQPAVGQRLRVFRAVWLTRTAGVLAALGVARFFLCRTWTSSQTI